MRARSSQIHPLPHAFLGLSRYRQQAQLSPVFIQGHPTNRGFLEKSPTNCVPEPLNVSAIGAMQIP